MPVPLRNLLLLGLILTGFNACKKDLITTDHTYMLLTDVDSVFFDTVFTSTSSITQQFKIINTNNRSINISSISLGGGISSPFKVNVDGTAGSSVNNVLVQAKDSIYIFVSVSINPDTSHLPFVVDDSIQINYNGNKKYVKLNAYG